MIDRVVFGDDSAPESDRMARHGKLRCILYDFFDGLDDDFPNLIYQRIGATADPKIIRQVFRTDQLTFTDS